MNLINETDYGDLYLKAEKLLKEILEGEEKDRLTAELPTGYALTDLITTRHSIACILDHDFMECPFIEVRLNMELEDHYFRGEYWMLLSPSLTFNDDVLVFG